MEKIKLPDDINLKARKQMIREQLEAIFGETSTKAKRRLRREAKQKKFEKTRTRRKLSTVSRNRNRQ